MREQNINVEDSENGDTAGMQLLPSFLCLALSSSLLFSYPRQSWCFHEASLDSSWWKSTDGTKEREEREERYVKDEVEEEEE